MPLKAFSPAARAWFEASFEAPTDAQTKGWDAIAEGDHALLLAPTGSGKTLAAFLWAIDRLMTEPPPARERRTRVLYVSPLRALAVEVEKNLRAPLAGIRLAAERLGVELHAPTVAMRTGDTSAQERRQIARRPPDILITTPESLYLMLTSQARRLFTGTQWVIVDEIHAVAQTKRGSHLAVTLERFAPLRQHAGPEKPRAVGSIPGAVSKKLQPASSAACTSSGDGASSGPLRIGLLSCQAPKPAALTRRPALPNADNS